MSNKRTAIIRIPAVFKDKLCNLAKKKGTSLTDYVDDIFFYWIFQQETGKYMPGIFPEVYPANEDDFLEEAYQRDRQEERDRIEKDYY